MILTFLSGTRDALSEPNISHVFDLLNIEIFGSDRASLVPLRNVKITFRSNYFVLSPIVASKKFPFFAKISMFKRSNTCEIFWLR